MHAEVTSAVTVKARCETKLHFVKRAWMLLLCITVCFALCTQVANKFADCTQMRELSLEENLTFFWLLFQAPGP